MPSEIRNLDDARAGRGHAVRRRIAYPESVCCAEAPVKLTLSVIKADVGSVGGHIAPSRARVAIKAAEMRRQGFFGAAMLPMSELEYTGIMEKLAKLDGRFTVRE